MNRKALILVLLAAMSMPAMVAQTSKEVADLLDKGVRKVEAGYASEALEFYNKAIVLQPDNMDVLAKRAFAYSIMKNYKGAVEDYTRIIELNPKQTIAYISRGGAYNKLNEFNLAVQDFNQALVLDPENQEALNNRGWAKKGLKDMDGACKDWKTAKKLGNEEAKIYLTNNQC